MNHYIQYHLYSATEIAFYQNYRIFPDDLFIKLQSLGFSRESHKPIQQEMDRIFFTAKTLSEFEPTDIDPFTTDSRDATT